MGILLKNGTVIDPVRGDCYLADVLIEHEKIAAVGAALPEKGHQIIDCTGLMVAPGLVDIHVHLRDPGLTYKEDIATGTAAAAAGGFTAVACMPNTKPAIDSVETLQYVHDTAKNTASCRVLPIAAVTVGQKGAELTDFDALSQHGAVAFSDDGVPVSSAKRMRDALKKAGSLGKIVISHCEDEEMVKNYAVNEGEISEKLGLPGRPAIAEDLMVARDLMLAEETGCHVHIAHVSTAGSAELIREAKKRGVPVTAETCPQYFIYTQEEILKKGTLARVNPPLRTDKDRKAILDAVIDGTLDCIVTDHAPHSPEEKAKALPDAPSGMVGLETSLAACITYLVKPGHITLPALMEKMSTIPSEILGLPAGFIEEGANADIVVFDPEEKWTVDPEQFRSKARNTVFAGETLCGKVKHTICGGKITF